MQTPDEHIQKCLAIEALALRDDSDLYLACLNGKPMKDRATEQELRDGCILVQHVYLWIKETRS